MQSTLAISLGSWFDETCGVLPQVSPLEVLRDALEKHAVLSQEKLQWAAYTHLACFGLDGRVLKYAARYFAEAEDQQALQDLLRLGQRYREVRAVWEIDQIGRRTSRSALTVDDFATWLQTQAVGWFDLYVDREQGVTWLEPEDADFLMRLARCYFPSVETFWEGVVSAPKFQMLPTERQAILLKLRDGEATELSLPPSKSARTHELFVRHCEAQGIKLLRTFQMGRSTGADPCNHVYLVLDRDGLVKVFKEENQYTDPRLNESWPLESTLYARLGPHPALPRSYGSTKIGETSFFKMSPCFGQTLAEMIAGGKALPVDDVIVIIGQLAELLSWMHARGFLYRDLRPENIVCEGPHVQLLDLEAGRFLDGQAEVDSTVFDARFAPPETATRYRASKASDVFQLGVLAHLLLTGQHPFEIPAASLQGGERARQLLRYTLGNVLLPYEQDLVSQFGDQRLSIISAMLAKDPGQRPTMEAVAQRFAVARSKPVVQPTRLDGRSSMRTKNTVLFPARMGIPHRGHIQFIARLMELGYHVTISLQRSYTITDADPLPKWLVMKMVAQSLFDLGFTPEHFDFIFTPFCATRAEHRLHFAMMPHAEDVVAIASGNEEVHQLFDGYPILDQRAVFGLEDQDYEVRSWGARLRAAIKDGDRATFEAYAASGVERILSLDELRKTYAATPIEFVRGQVRVRLLDAEGGVVVEGRVRRYLSPEETLVLLCRLAGKDLRLIDPYASGTACWLDGKHLTLHYRSTVMDAAGDEIITFQY